MNQLNKNNRIVMENAEITLVFNEVTAMLENIKYKNENLAASSDQYKLQLRNDCIIALEDNNQVSSYEKGFDYISFRLSNPEIPDMEIVQEYKLYADQVSKKVTFIPLKNIDGFVCYMPGGKLASEFRQGSVYQTLRGWDVKTIFNSDEITETTRIGHPQAFWGNKIVTVSRTDKNLCLAHFAWKQDNEFTWLITQMHGESTKYTSFGWLFPAMYFHPAAGRSFSFESIFQIVNGTHLNFYDNYRSRNEVQAIITKEHPAWLRDTKLEYVCWRNPVADYAETMQRLIDASRYSEDENGLITIWGWTDWGRFPVKDDDTVFTGRDGEKEACTALQMKEMISAAQKNNPSVKMGLYQLLWSLPPSAETDNPDWLSYNPDGELVKMNTEPGWVPIYRRLCNPESRKSIIEGLNKLYNYYPLDFMYLDGGVRGQSYPDWKTMSCDSANLWLDLWKEIFENITDSHPDYALFCNNPFPIYSHAGYSENGSFGRWYNEDWRCLADIFCIVKSFQVPDRFLAVMYRTTGYRTNEPQYTNMLLATGLQPSGAKDPDIHPDLESLPAYLPYINAAFELRDTVLKNAVQTPRYFEPGAQVQCNVLKLRNTLLISALRHTGNPDEELELTIDNEKAGLSSGKKYCLYRVDVKPAEIKHDVKLPEKGEKMILENIAETTFLGSIELRGESSSFCKKIPVNRLRFLVLSESCARIIKVNGRDTQFQLPSLLKASVGTSLKGGSLKIKINSPYNNITARVNLPVEFDHDDFEIEPAGLQFDRFGDEIDITIPQNVEKIILKKETR